MTAEVDDERVAPGADAFESSRECFEEALGWLKGAEASALAAMPT